jgi:hypothetical protein
MMAFSEATLHEAWRLAQGRCECQRRRHGHRERCGAILTWEQRGLIGASGWQAIPWTPFADGGQDEVANCELLCWKCFAPQVAAARTSADAVVASPRS